VSYLHVPLVEDPATRRAESRLAPRTLGEAYRYALEFRGPQFATILRRFVEPDGLPAVVHCTAGKDRTGLVIALALGAAGVADNVIAADYARSAEYLVGGYVDEARERAVRRGIAWEEYQQSLGCPPALMLETLDWLRIRYGSVEAYLLQQGLREAELATLRRALTE
jgi:protein-tyrosine phosphatase